MQCRFDLSIDTNLARKDVAMIDESEGKREGKRWLKTDEAAEYRSLSLGTTARTDLKATPARPDQLPPTFVKFFLTRSRAIARLDHPREYPRGK